MTKWFQRRDFVWLFGALLLLYIVYPFLQKHWLAGAVLNVFISGSLLAAVLRTGWRRWRMRLSIVLGIPTLALIWVSHFHPSDAVILARAIFEAAFFACTATLILETIVRAKRVTRNVVFGAACFYLLLGHIWTFLYVFIESVVPGSFQLRSLESMVEISARGQALIAEFMYYSAVTLTTVGYGDITPITPGARMVSSLEAMAGQLTVAFLIARIVGLYVAHNVAPPASARGDSV